MAFVFYTLAVCLLVIGVHQLETGILVMLRPAYYQAWPRFSAYIVIPVSLFLPGSGQIVLGRLLEGTVIAVLFWGTALSLIPLPLNVTLLGTTAAPVSTAVLARRWRSDRPG